jgi:hypothetical protein
MRSLLQPVSFFFLFFIVISASAQRSLVGQPHHNDIPYQQKHSVKYLLPGQQSEDDGGKIRLQTVDCDRNGEIRVFSSAGILRPSAGQQLFPGSLIPDVSYRPLVDRKVSSGRLYDQQFIYLDDKAVFSNAWAGKLYLQHTLPGASVFSGGLNFSFLISDSNSLQYLTPSGVDWNGYSKEKVLEILFDKSRNIFWTLTENSISVFTPATKTLVAKFKGRQLSSFALSSENNELIVGTRHGLFSNRR